MISFGLLCNQTTDNISSEIMRKMWENERCLFCTASPCQSGDGEWKWTMTFLVRCPFLECSCRCWFPLGQRSVLELQKRERENKAHDVTLRPWKYTHSCKSQDPGDSVRIAYVPEHDCVPSGAAKALENSANICAHCGGGTSAEWLLPAARDVHMLLEIPRELKQEAGFFLPTCTDKGARKTLQGLVKMIWRHLSLTLQPIIAISCLQLLPFPIHFPGGAFAFSVCSVAFQELFKYSQRQTPTLTWRRTASSFLSASNVAPLPKSYTCAWPRLLIW